MQKSQHSYQKRKRELANKKKQEDKRQRIKERNIKKAEKNQDDAGEGG